MKTRIEVDEYGHLILPPEIMRRYGLIPGAQLLLEENENNLKLLRTPAALSRVYVEPTNHCNLDCRTCMRNAWDEPLGKMKPETFDRILDGVKQFSPTPLVFFGGFGEPLAHPAILDMISAAKEIGAAVELITNGILLNEETIQSMIRLRVDRLWVSIDGATPESYADVRLGDALPTVLTNLSYLQDLRSKNGTRLPKLGIAFVAMKRNIADMPEVVRLGKLLGADRFSISNVLPHTTELCDQVLYAHSMSDSDYQPSRWSPEVAIPRMTLDEVVIKGLAKILKGRNNLRIGQQSSDQGVNTCPFFEKGSVSIRWDGIVSPCLPLLHTHTSYLAETPRTSHAFTVGNIHDRTLTDLWNDPEYVRLRERLQEFDFSPCTFCNSCDMAEANLEDCFGNIQPACGGCLWAQGFIQCP